MFTKTVPDAYKNKNKPKTDKVSRFNQSSYEITR